MCQGRAAIFSMRFRITVWQLNRTTSKTLWLRRAECTMSPRTEKMNFTDAKRFITDHGIAMVLDGSNGICGVGIGRKDGGVLVEATDYCITAFVPEKLTEAELNSRNRQTFAHACQAVTGQVHQGDVQVDVVETGGVFRTQPAFSVPNPQRGRFGGNPPALNAQKAFTSLRCGMGIANPVGLYPHNPFGGDGRILPARRGGRSICGFKQPRDWRIERWNDRRHGCTARDA